MGSKWNGNFWNDEKINVERPMSNLEVIVSESVADFVQTNDQLDMFKVKVVHNENELKDIKPRLPNYAEKASVSCGSSVKLQPVDHSQLVYGLLAGILVLIILASMEQIFFQDL